MKIKDINNHLIKLKAKMEGMYITPMIVGRSAMTLHGIRHKANIIDLHFHSRHESMIMNTLFKGEETIDYGDYNIYNHYPFNLYFLDDDTIPNPNYLNFFHLHSVNEILHCKMKMNRGDIETLKELDSILKSGVIDISKYPFTQDILWDRMSLKFIPLEEFVYYLDKRWGYIDQKYLTMDCFFLINFLCNKFNIMRSLTWKFWHV